MCSFIFRIQKTSTMLMKFTSIIDHTTYINNDSTGIEDDLRQTYVYFTSFHQENCRLLQVLMYIGMKSTTLSTCTLHTKSGAIHKHVRQEHNMLLLGPRCYLIHEFYLHF